MKKNLIFILIVTLLISILPGYALAKSSKEHLQFKLDIDTSEDALYIQNNHLIQKGNKERFNRENFSDANGFVELNMFYEINDNTAYIKGNGVVHLQNDTYPISYDGRLKIESRNDNNYIFGPIPATIKNSKGTEDGLLGLYYNFDNQETYVSFTAGNIDFDNGNGMLYFGKKTDIFKEIIEEKRTLVTKESTNENNLATISSTEIIQLPDHILRGSEYTFRTGYSDNYTDPGSYNDWLNHNALVLNIYDIDPKTNGSNPGQVQVRAWTNTPAIEEYMSDNGGSRPIANVEELQITLEKGGTTAWLDIDETEAYPKDSEPLSLSPAWKFVSLIPRYGTTVDIIANAYVALLNTDPDIYSTDKTDINYTWSLTKYLTNNLGTAPNLPNISTTDIQSELIKEGGVMVWFRYNAMTTATTGELAAKGQAIYFGSDDPGYPFGFYYTPEISYTWTAQLK